MSVVADPQFRHVPARADVVAYGDVDLRGLPEHVAASWRRSSARGVPQHGVTPAYHDDLERDSRLVHCAQPVIKQLAEVVADVPVSVALTDERARLLARRDGDSPLGRAFDRVYFAPGFDYAEGVVGTNGVGTAVEFGGPVRVVGAEHFVAALQGFACAGAPVRDPFTGRIAGVLDLSCMRERWTPVMHSLVRSAASRIERGLLRDRSQAQQALFDAYVRADARSGQAAFAVGPQVVLASSALQALLDPGDQAALHDHVRFAMLRHPTLDDRLELPSGLRVRLRGRAVQTGAEVAGMVGVVSPLREGDGATRSATAGGWDPLPMDDTQRTLAASSQSPAWRAAATTVEAAVRAGDPVLVLGESGSGRSTLLTRVHQLWYERGRSVTLTSDEVDAAPRQVVARLRESIPDPTLYILRDVDRLSARTVDLLADQLGGVRPPTLLAATASESVTRRPAHQRLLTVFRASATVPALRHRRADLPALVEALLADLAPNRDVRLSREALSVVTAYDWPGNVVQLTRALSAALARRPVGAIRAEDLPALCQSVPRTALRLVDETERDTIVTALREARGNRVAAAAALGIARSTLYRKIRQYGITA